MGDRVNLLLLSILNILKNLFNTIYSFSYKLKSYTNRKKLACKMKPKKCLVLGSNQGPWDLKVRTLPLSYRPFIIKIAKIAYKNFLLDKLEIRRHFENCL